MNHRAVPRGFWGRPLPLLACLLLLGSSVRAAEDSAAPTASTQFGPVRGMAESGIDIFKGIPYGAATSGANRFRPPAPPRAWTKVRDATVFGDRCPQLTLPDGPAFSSWTEPTHASEDCLNLNVWTPGLRDGRRRPVMVWLHGGGYALSSGASSVFDGTRLAKRGDVVVVTLNHRLNLFGYLYLAKLAGSDYADSGNVGQLDIVAALHWVHDNIAEFGGDPNTVMIFGESGGGGKVGTLMAMPAAKGLFQRAAMESGFAVTALSADAATKTAESFLAALHLKKEDVRRLASLPVATLLAALDQLTHGSPFGFGPVVDGHSLPRDPFSPDAPEVSADVPLIVGSNGTETTVLFPPPGAFDLDWDGLDRQLQATGIAAAAVGTLVAGFRRLKPDATPSDLYFDITTQRGMGANATAVAERKAALGRAPAYLYRLEWRTPVEGGRLRSPHALDVPLVFDNVAKSASLLGPDVAQTQRVADAMSDAWIAFARSGTPSAPGLASWPAYDTRLRSTMVFNEVSRSVDDPRHAERALLAPVARRPSSP